jgi:DNA-binding MarR family transcriptional regulator
MLGMGDSPTTQPDPLAPPDSLLRQIRATYFDLIGAFGRQVGIRQARLELLAQLRHADEVSQAKLQQRLGVDGAAITRTLKPLEAEGLVTRRADPRDNRFTLVALTEVGRCLVDDVMARRAPFEALVTDGLSEDELAVFRRCLERMRANVRALPDDGAGTPKDRAPLSRVEGG